MAQMGYDQFQNDDGYQDQNGVDYFTWDLLIKNIYKLPLPQQFLEKEKLKHVGFFQ